MADGKKYVNEFVSATDIPIILCTFAPRLLRVGSRNFGKVVRRDHAHRLAAARLFLVYFILFSGYIHYNMFLDHSANLTFPDERTTCFSRTRPIVIFFSFS